MELRYNIDENVIVEYLLVTHQSSMINFKMQDSMISFNVLINTSSIFIIVPLSRKSSSQK